MTTLAHIKATMLAEMRSIPRDEMSGWVPRPDGSDEEEPEWASVERQVLLGEVNDCRRQRGLPEVGVRTLLRVERLAAQRSEYDDALAFYCAELAMGAAPP